MKKIMNFIKEEDGLELSEYAVMGALVVLGVATVIGTLGADIKNVFTSIASTISGVGGDK